jgi:hypothetical protein
MGPKRGSGPVETASDRRESSADESSSYGACLPHRRRSFSALATSTRSAAVVVFTRAGALLDRLLKCRNSRASCPLAVDVARLAKRAHSAWAFGNQPFAAKAGETVEQVRCIGFRRAVLVLTVQVDGQNLIL